MGKKTMNRLLNIFGYAIIGILAGIVIGLIFGLFIAKTASLFSTEAMNEPVPLQIGAFFGMGAGAIISGIFSAVVAYKD